MNQQERTNFEIHPMVARVLRILGLGLVCLAVFLSARTAFTFCLGLFADGNHVVYLPGQGDPIVSLEQHQEKQRPLNPWEREEVSRAELLVAGNLIPHLPIVQSAWTGDGYDFHSLFSYLSPYLAEADLTCAALETTFAGYNKGISAEPWFNSPDELAAALHTAGFDLVTTANEHAYDTDVSGLLRTRTTAQSAGLTVLGTVSSAEEPRYQIRTVGGISIGMAAYTQCRLGDDGSVTVNGLTADAQAAAYLNVFDSASLSRFYTEVEGFLTAMKASGAQATMLFLHWGSDYATTPDATQRSIAQTLCDMGVDVIVGSHPQVVQPVDLLTSSTDPDHRTLVVYSPGSLLSNLRADTTDVISGHTEDAYLLRITLSRYQDDSVDISAVSLIPTWTALYGSDRFCILPLSSATPDWALAYDLSDSQLHDAKSSYNRTMAIVTSGLNKISHALTATTPGSAAPAPTETAPPATTEPLGVG